MKGKQLRIGRIKAAIAAFAAMAAVGAAAIPAQATTGSFPSTSGSTYRNVQWRAYPFAPYKFMAGDKLFDNGSTTKAGITLGKVRVLDFTTSHFPVTAAVDTINSYLAANSNMFRLEYVWNGGNSCSGHLPCIEVRETNDPMAILGQATVSGGFCSLSTHNYVLMSWPNMSAYSTTARKGAVMHEIYHAIGLPHSSNSNDIMYSGAGEPASPTTGINRATPSASDSTTVSLLYGRWGTDAGYGCTPNT
jgi:hypothetical protein